MHVTNCCCCAPKMYGSRLLSENQQVCVVLMSHVELCTHQSCLELMWRSTKTASKTGLQNHAHKRDITKEVPKLLCSPNQLARIGNRHILRQQGCELLCLAVALKLGNAGKVCQKLQNLPHCM